VKKEYYTIKDLVAESGFGWDFDRKMATAYEMFGSNGGT